MRKSSIILFKVTFPEVYNQNIGSTSTAEIPTQQQPTQWILQKQRKSLYSEILLKPTTAEEAELP